MEYCAFDQGGGTPIVPKLKPFVSSHPLVCPHCAEILSGHVGPKGGEIPNAGDILVCVGCGEPAILETTPELRLRTPTVTELAAFYSRPEAAAVRAIMRANPGDTATALSQRIRAALTVTEPPSGKEQE